MKLITLFFAALALFLGSCERHDWEETKKLYEHGDHKDDGKKEGEKSENDGKKDSH